MVSSGPKPSELVRLQTSLPRSVGAWSDLSDRASRAEVGRVRKIEAPPPLLAKRRRRSPRPPELPLPPGREIREAFRLVQDVVQGRRRDQLVGLEVPEGAGGGD